MLPFDGAETVKDLAWQRPEKSPVISALVRSKVRRLSERSLGAHASPSVDVQDNSQAFCAASEDPKGSSNQNFSDWDRGRGGFAVEVAA